MKVLFKKLKKTSKIAKFFYMLSFLLYGGSLAYFIQGILQLKNIETLLRVIGISIFIVWFLIYVFMGLITLIAKKKKTFIFITFITIILCPALIFASYAINQFTGTVSQMNHDTIKYTSNLVALKTTKFNKDSVIGMIKDRNDIEGNVLAKKLIKIEELSNDVKNYDDYDEMVADLYKGEIDAMFVTSNYSITFANRTFEATNEEEAANEVPFAERVKVLYEYSEERKNQDQETLSESKTKSLTEPFTILVMGVDSDIDGLKANQAFNGDTLIMVTFNPNTLTATMFSIPRDMYVPIACNGNRSNKINSSAAYGSTCVINTVQNLTGIKIDYYVKMNFIGVVQLVDALGGVTVDVEEPDFWYDNQHQNQVCEQNSHRSYNDLVCMGLGTQKLDGEQALAYARCRHLYAISDIARNQHQQAIIEAMAQKLKTINSMQEFKAVLDAVSNNIETNISSEQIMSFYTVGKDMLLNSNNESTALSVKKTFLSYYSLPVYTSWGSYTSALGYHQASLDAITDLMKVNLELKDPKPIKTFKISYQEDYTTPLVGYGIAGGAKQQTMKDFVGFAKSYVQDWCSKNNVSCTFVERDSDRERNEVIDQDVHDGVLVENIRTATFYVSNGKAKQETSGEKNFINVSKAWAEEHSCKEVKCKFKLGETIQDPKAEKDDDPITKQEGSGTEDDPYILTYNIIKATKKQDNTQKEETDNNKEPTPAPNPTPENKDDEGEGNTTPDE